MNYNNAETKLLALGKSMEDNVEINNEFKLDEKISLRRKFSFKVVAIIIIICLLLSTAAFASAPYIRMFFDDFGNAGLNIADNNNLIEKNLGTVTNNGITMTLTSGMATGESIVLTAKYEGIEDKEYSQIVDARYNAKLSDINNIYEESLTNDFFHNKITKIKNKTYEEGYQFNGSLKGSSKLRFEVYEIAGVKGNWTIDFELSYYPSQKYHVNKTIEYNGDVFIIDFITVDATSTRMEMRGECFQNIKYQLLLDSDQKYESNFSGTFSTSLCYKKSTIDGSDACEFKTIPFKPNSVLILSIRQYGIEPVKWDTFTIELKESDLVK